jgi:hypothetical protein
MSAATRPARVARAVPPAILLALAPALSLAEDGERYRLRSPFDDPEFTLRTAPAAGKNTAVALGEVLLVNFVMWQGSYWMGKQYAKISTDTIAQNFSKGWIIDTDGFWTNQFGHPLEGAFFYTAARSTGHGPYESFGVSFLGSLVWESFMETQSPSVNDQVITPGGGSVFGEVLYRMYRLIIDSAGARPSGWRKFGAFAVSPMTGANEFLFGERYRGPTLLPPSWMGEFHFGVVVGGSVTDVRTGARESAVGPWTNLAAHIAYGVPGTPDLRLRRPFDHFDARFAYSFTDQAQPSASMLIRGVLVGDTIESGEAPLGLWGLFTSYDVISVPLFKAAGFGVGPGVSLMKRWRGLELHGTALAELLPWAGGGSIEKLYERDYHYGPGAKAVLDLRALFGDRLILDLIGREYWISGAYATRSSEDVTWTRAALTVRVVGPHAASVSVDWSRRHASYPANPDISERGAAIQAHYTLLQGW